MQRQSGLASSVVMLLLLVVIISAIFNAQYALGTTTTIVAKDDTGKPCVLLTLDLITLKLLEPNNPNATAPEIVINASMAGFEAAPISRCAAASSNSTGPQALSQKLTISGGGGLSLDFDFLGNSTGPGHAHVLSWYLASLEATYAPSASNGTAARSTGDVSFNSSNAIFNAPAGYGLTCAFNASFAPTPSSSSDLSIVLVNSAVQPFNVAANQTLPIAAPSSDGSLDQCQLPGMARDHTLAIAIAGAIAGLVLVSGIIYLFVSRKKQGGYSPIS
eukprot:UC1_evm2s1932